MPNYKLLQTGLNLLNITRVCCSQPMGAPASLVHCDCKQFGLPCSMQQPLPLVSLRMALDTLWNPCEAHLRPLTPCVMAPNTCTGP